MALLGLAAGAWSNGLSMNRQQHSAATLPALEKYCGGAGPSEPQNGELVVRRIVPVGMDRPLLPQVEPVVAVDPRDSARLAAALMTVEDAHGDGFWNSWRVQVLVSRDGGRSWVRNDLPGTPAGRALGDASLRWAADGGLYLSAMVTDGQRRMSVWVFRSTDGGRTWAPGTEIPSGTSASPDHPVLDLADPGDATPQLVLFATAAFTGVSVATTPAGRMNWTSLPIFSPNQENNNLAGGVMLITGRLLFTYYSMSRPMPTPLWAVFSDDGGGTWTRTQVTARNAPVGFPMLAEDRSDGPHRGRVYQVLLPAEDEANVSVSHSDDGGATWSLPVVVHRDRSSVLRARPIIAVNGVGQVAVSWADQRNAGPAGGRCWDVYAAASTDGGETFLPESRLTKATSCASVPGNGQAGTRWWFGGDYAGIATDSAGRFYLVWSDSRSGVFQPWLAVLSVSMAP